MRCKQFTRQCYSISDGLFSIIVCIIIMTTTIIPPLNRSARWSQTSRRSTAHLRTILNQGGFTFTFRKIYCLLLLHRSQEPQNIFFFACLHFERLPNPKFCLGETLHHFFNRIKKTLQILHQLFIRWKLCLISSMFDTYMGSIVATTKTFVATFLFRIIKLWSGRTCPEKSLNSRNSKYQMLKCTLYTWRQKSLETCLSLCNL